MGLGLPLALLGLVGVALPILAHLMRKRDVPVVPFPPVALLRRALARSQRRSKVVDALLLACRVALVVLAALGVAAPYFERPLAYGDGKPVSLAVVVDDSMSMTRTSDGSSLLQLARVRARSILESLPANSEIAVILGGAPARVLVARTLRLGHAIEELEALPSDTARGTDLESAIAEGARELVGSTNASQRVVVLSDFAGGAPIQKRSVEEGVEIQFERIGANASSTNFGVVSARAVPHESDHGKLHVHVQVRAFGSKEASVPVVLRVGEAQVLRQSAALSKEGFGSVSFEVQKPSGGDVFARAEIAGSDALPGDDARPVLLRQLGSTRVLIVNGAPDSSASQDEVRFFTRALDLAPEDRGAIDYHVVDSDSFDQHDLSTFDVIVLANALAPRPAGVQALKTFVQRGGGLIVTAGDHIDPRAHTTALADLLPARIRAAAAYGQAGLTASPEPDWLPDGDVGLGATTIEKRLILDKIDDATQVLIRFEDDLPALATRSNGAGRVALLATTIDADWTDLPLRPGYLPLVVQLIHRVARLPSLPSDPFAPGSVVRIPRPPAATAMEVYTPSRRRFVFGEERKRPSIPFDHTTEPGAYRVRVATRDGVFRDEPRAAFAVAPPPTESDVTRYDIPSRRHDDTSRVSRVAHVLRYSLSPFVFLLLGLFLVLEGWLRWPGFPLRSRGRDLQRQGEGAPQSKR